MIKDILWKLHTPKAAKVLLYKTYYFPMVTHGAETWVWTKKDQTRMQADETKFLCSIEK
jgi:hypothetical protein